MSHFGRLCARLSALFLLSASFALAQNICPSAANWVRPVSGSIFNDQQEIWLGDAIADHIEREYRIANDPATSAYLDGIGKRLLAVLPPTNIRFRFIIIDSGEVNGFSLAGGRIYITRRLIANAHSEDEVAGVLAHEIGHIVTHQSAVEISAAMQRLLNVTSVNDRADIYDKFRRMMDAERNDTKHRASHDSDAEQNVADRVAVYSMASAGYQPQSYATFWDRSFFVNGKTGNGLSDFFGVTKPGERRLRQIRQLVTELPQGCGSTTASNSQEFQQWQNQVIANQRSTNTKQDIEGQVAIALESPLRMDLQRIRFSPDGKYLLAQDESSVFVLERQPLKFLFRFDADDAMPAQWNPESSQISFHTSRLHVEQWNIAQRRLVAAHEVIIKDRCVQTLLSPDARTLMCISFSESSSLSSFPFNLSLIDTSSNQIVFQKNNLFSLNYYGALQYFLMSEFGQPPDIFNTATSQDGNFLVIGVNGDVFGKIAFDLRTRTQIQIGSDFAGKVSGAFAFAGANIAGVDISTPKNSGWFAFPGGKALGHLPMHFSALNSVSKGDYLTTRDLAKDLVYILNLQNQKAMQFPKIRNVDLWNSSLAAEAPDGSLLIGNFSEDTGLKPTGRETLPLSPLGRLSVTEISPDGRYLALSGKSRGAIWDLQTGKQLFLIRGFTGATFQGNDTVYLDIPKNEATERKIFLLELSTKKVRMITYKPSDTTFIRSNRLQEWKEGDKNTQIMTIRNLPDGAEIWSHPFEKGRPRVAANYADDNLIAAWSITSDTGKAEIKKSPTLATRVAALKDKNTGVLVEVFSSENGSLLKTAILSMPYSSIQLDDFNVIGDTILVSTRDNRVLFYSATTGELQHQIFGYVVAADATSRLICVKNRTDEVYVYDLEAKEISHLTPGTPVRYSRIVDNGKKVFLLGADQKARVVGLPMQLAITN